MKQTEYLEKILLENINFKYENLKLKNEIGFWKGLAIAILISYIIYIIIIILGK